MNEKRAKKLRRVLMTHDEWLDDKRNRKYIFVNASRPRAGNNVIFYTDEDDLPRFGRVKKTERDTLDISDGTKLYEKVPFEKVRPFQAACAPDKISQYKEAKRHVRK